MVVDLLQLEKTVSRSSLSKMEAGLITFSSNVILLPWMSD